MRLQFRWTKYIEVCIIIYLPWKGLSRMEKLVREYERGGVSVKIYAPDATEGEKAVRRAEIRERVLRAVELEEKSKEARA